MPDHFEKPGRDAEGRTRGAECWSAKINRAALYGLPRVRRDPEPRLADGPAIAASIEDRRGTDVARAVSDGMLFATDIRQRGLTVEAVGREAGRHPLTVLHEVALYDADVRGSLAHAVLRTTDGGGWARPMTMVQAEIAAGIRDVFGEYCGVFAGVTDYLAPDGRSANAGGC